MLYLSNVQDFFNEVNHAERNITGLLPGDRSFLALQKIMRDDSETYLNKTLAEICLEYGFSPENFARSATRTISVHVEFGAIRCERYGTKGFSIMVSDFPGNCSTVVISGIQTLFSVVNTNHFDRAIDFGKAVARALSYTNTMVSVTDVAVVNYLKNKGFVVIFETNNAHSENMNYFLVAKNLE